MVAHRKAKTEACAMEELAKMDAKTMKARLEAVQRASEAQETMVAEALRAVTHSAAAKTAEAEVIKLQARAQAEAFGAVKAAFAGMTSEELLHYVYLEKLVGGDFNDVNVGLKIPSEITNELVNTNM